MLMLQLFSLLVFCHSLPLSLWVFLLLLTCGLIFVSAISHPGMLFIYVVRQEHALQQGDSTIDELKQTVLIMRLEFDIH
jgi:hypothetical protein